MCRECHRIRSVTKLNIRCSFSLWVRTEPLKCIVCHKTNIFLHWPVNQVVTRLGPGGLGILTYCCKKLRNVIRTIVQCSTRNWIAWVLGGGVGDSCCCADIKGVQPLTGWAVYTTQLHWLKSVIHRGKNQLRCNAVCWTSYIGWTHSGCSLGTHG